MGTYNRTRVDLRCPRCDESISNVEVNLYFGRRSGMVFVALGEEYPFDQRKQPHNDGPLPEDSPWGQGYTECPKCGRDYYCACRVERGRLVEVEVDLETAPHISDEVHGRVEPCPICGRAETRVHLFEGYDIGNLVCDNPQCDAIVTVVSLDADRQVVGPYQRRRKVVRAGE